MREIELTTITNTVKELFLEAGCHIDDTTVQKLAEAKKVEASMLGKTVLSEILINHELALQLRKPACQDTGIAVVFMEIGSEVVFYGDLQHAVDEGVKGAYEEGYFRKSVVRHPLDRVNTHTNTPAILHTKIVPGKEIQITVCPKGAGSENMGVLRMLVPADGIPGVKRVVLETIEHAGGKACPPLIVGVGIGGNFEYAPLLAKAALLEDIDSVNPDPLLQQLETELLDEINQLGIGPMGFGGTVTALAVKIKSYPCHIASLPVAVNLQCHANRHCTKII